MAAADAGREHRRRDGGDMKEGAADRGAGGAVGRRGVVAAPSATRVAAASHGTTRAAAAEALLCGSVGRRELP